MNSYNSINQYMQLGEVKRLTQRFSDELTKGALKTVAVLSLEPKEGRTFLTAVLAIGMATFFKKRVIIIDTTADDACKNIAGNAITVLTARNLTSATDEPLDFQLMNLIEQQQNQYDLMLLDTTAITAGNSENCGDPLIAGRIAGSAILVTSQRSLRYGNLSEVKYQLSNMGISLLGMVNNSGQRTGQRTGQRIGRTDE